MPHLSDLDPATLSPYLAQHVANPVRWWAWGADALEEAVRRDRPIFLSVGYAACHWCHVMAHESFEDPDIARRLNEAFIPIKVDREERPDVDELYMAATQLLSGHGGWPMSVFTLPDGRPFYAGTYYPPVDRGGQVGFARLLDALDDAWSRQRASVETQAAELAEATTREVRLVDHLAPSAARVDLPAARAALRRGLVERADGLGGFGPAPKFPRPSYVTALLDGGDESERALARDTLDAMARQGLYDHLGGGFARYSVDARWHVPHFEKMLSDQALLARAYLLADREAGGGTWWRQVGLDALGFARRELAVDGGFAASLDADAGGVEGGHVTWTPSEVREALERADALDLLDETLHRWRLDEPVLEGRSVPRLADGEPFSTPPSLRRAHEALLSARRRRAAPARDRKVVLEWNAMTASALLATRDPDLESEGVERLERLLGSHHDGTDFWRTHPGGARATAADLAWLADALVDAYESTGEDRHATAAHRVLVYLLDHHWDGERPDGGDPLRGQGLFTTSDAAHDLPVRPKEILDGATPSAHAVSLRAFARLGGVLGDAQMLAIAERLVNLAEELLVEHPLAVPDLLEAAGFALERVEAVLPGPPNPLGALLRSRAVRRTVLVSGTGGSPLLEGRAAGLAYLCRAGVCELPVADGPALLARLVEMGA